MMTELDNIKSVLLLLFFISAIALTGCSGVKSEAKYPTGADRNTVSDPNNIYEEPEGIFGNAGIFGPNKKDADDGGSGIGVNKYLWRASLDTVSFMPLASADPFGGVILTDWYSSPGAPDERIKINVFILDRQLRSDGIQVKVFKQTSQGNDWRDAETSGETARKLEDTILTRARQMRVAKM